MHLLDLITHLATTDTLDEFLTKAGVQLNSEHLSVYMQEILHPDSSILVLGVEQTGEAMDYYEHGIHYEQLLPLQEVIEIAEGGLQASINPVAIAQRIVDYAINDA